MIGEVGVVEARSLGNLVLAAAVELNGPDLLLARIALIGEVPEGLRGVVDRLDGGDFVVAALDLVAELHQGAERVIGVESVAIDVGVAVAPAEDEEGVIADELHVVGHGEVFRLGLLEDAAQVAGVDVGKPEVEVLMIAGEDFDPEDAGIDPAEAGDVVVADVHGNFEPAGVAAAGADDADVDGGIGIAGLGITLLVDGGVDGDPVDERVLGDAGLVHLEVGDFLRVRRPEVVAADVELFEVNPVDNAVEEGAVVRVGEGQGGRGAIGPLDVEIVVVEVGDELAVGGKPGIVAGRQAGVADLHAGAVLQRVEPEGAVGIEKDVLGVGRPDVVGLVITGAVIAVALGQGGVEQDGDFAVGDQFFGSGVGRLDGGEVALVVDPGGEFAIGGPADALGRVAGEIAGVAEDFGDGPGMVGLGVGQRNGGGEDESEDRGEARNEMRNQTGNRAAKGLAWQAELQKDPETGNRVMVRKENSKPSPWQAESMRGGGASAFAFFHKEDEGDHAGGADGEHGDDVEIGELSALADELLVEVSLGHGLCGWG